MAAASSKRQREAAWWLVETHERCSTCNHGFAHRTEFYCIDCDGAVCPVCIQRTVMLEFVCPGCFSDRHEEAGAQS
jgi:hypothetical protein